VYAFKSIPNDWEIHDAYWNSAFSYIEFRTKRIGLRTQAITRIFEKYWV
jgi:hypothetical protein